MTEKRTATFICELPADYRLAVMGGALIVASPSQPPMIVRDDKVETVTLSGEKSAPPPT